MGVYIDIFEELRSRFANELGAGNVLEDIKRVYVGRRQDVNFNTDLPLLIMDIDSITELYSGQKRKRGIINVTVSLITKLTDEKAENLIYDTATNSGMLYLIEKVFDVANTNTASEFDPRLAQNSFESMQVSTGPITKLSEGFLQVDLFFELKAREFVGNTRG